MKELILLKSLIIVLLQTYGTKTQVEFNGSCLKQDKVTFNHGEVVNIYTVCETSRNINISEYPTLENCLLGAVSLTKNVDIDKYKYSEYGIGFDRHGSFSLPGTGLGRNVIIFGADTSSSTKIDNKKKIFWFWVKISKDWSVDNMKKTGFNGYVYNFTIIL